MGKATEVVLAFIRLKDEIKCKKKEVRILKRQKCWKALKEAKRQLNFLRQDAEVAYNDAYEAVNAELNDNMEEVIALNSWKNAITAEIQRNVRDDFENGVRWTAEAYKTEGQLVKQLLQKVVNKLPRFLRKYVKNPHNVVKFTVYGRVLGLFVNGKGYKISSKGISRFPEYTGEYAEYSTASFVSLSYVAQAAKVRKTKAQRVREAQIAKLAKKATTKAADSIWRIDSRPIKTDILSGELTGDAENNNGYPEKTPRGDLYGGLLERPIPFRIQRFCEDSTEEELKKLSSDNREGLGIMIAESKIIPVEAGFSGLRTENPYCYVLDTDNQVWYFDSKSPGYRVDTSSEKVLAAIGKACHPVIGVEELGAFLNNKRLKLLGIRSKMLNGKQNVTDKKPTVHNVRNKSDLQHLYTQRIGHRDNEGYACSYLQFRDDDYVTVSQQMMPYTVMADFMQFWSGLRVASEEGNKLYQKRFTDDIIVLNCKSFKGISKLYDPKREIAYPIYKVLSPDGADEFYIALPEAPESMKEYRNVEGPIFLGLVNGAVIGSLKEFEEYARFGYYEYDGAYGVTSPGLVKQHSIILAGKYHGPERGRGIDWHAIYSALFGEAWDLWIEKVQDTDENGIPTIGYKDVSQFATRMAHWAAPAKHFSRPMRCFCVYGGKFRAEMVDWSIDENGKPKQSKIKVDYEDGQGFVNANYVKDCFNDELNKDGEQRYLVWLEAVLYQLYQTRSLALCDKEDALAVDDDDIWHLMKLHSKVNVRVCVQDILDCNEKGIEVREDNKEPYYVQTTDLDDFMHNKGKGRWSGKNVLFYNSREDFEAGIVPDFYTDFNGLKCGFRPWITFPHLTILAAAHEDEGKQVLSSQLLQSAMAGNLALTWKLVMGLMAVNIEKVRNKLTNRKQHEVTWQEITALKKITIDCEGKEVVEDTSFSQTIEQLCVNYAMDCDVNLNFKRVERFFLKLSKQIRKLNILCTGTHVTLLSDIGMLFGKVQLLDVKNGIMECYGANGIGNITKKEYIKRVKDSEMSNAAKERAIKAIEGLAPGILVVPCTDEFTRANEGSDWDSDSMYVFKLVETIRKFLKEAYGIEECNDEDLNAFCNAACDYIIQYFKSLKDGEKKAGLIIEMLLAAKKSWIQGEVWVALRYPKNHDEGTFKLNRNFFPTTLCVRING